VSSDSRGARRRSSAALPRALLLAALPLALGACEFIFTDFKDQPKIEPWEAQANGGLAGDTTRGYTGNPQLSVPVYGSRVPGYAVSYQALPATVDSMSGLQNPTAPDQRSLANGRKHYQINCAVCHGAAGRGDGPVVRFGMPGIALVTEVTRNRSDGYIYGMIRNGRGLMPPYNRIEDLDRWDVVNYVRGLQGRFAVQTGPVGRPGETGQTLPGYTETAPTRPAPYFDHTSTMTTRPRAGATGVNQQRPAGAPGVAPGTGAPVDAPLDSAGAAATPEGRP
jgi:mono/diheme cytochrome c family protein